MNKVHACVASGGGNSIYFAAAFATALHHKGRDYTIYGGSSQGALLAPHLATRNFHLLKQAILSDDDKIYSVNPFTKKGNIRLFNAIYRFLIGKRTLGESYHLYDLIKESFTEEHFNSITDKIIYACAVDIRRKGGRAVYYSNDDDYLTYIKGMFASACFPMMMSLVRDGDRLLTDGGIKQHVPIQYAIDLGATDIDVIVCKDAPSDELLPEPKNIIQLAKRLFDILMSNVTESNINIANLIAREKDVTINIYYQPKELRLDNTIVFDPVKGKEIYGKSYRYGLNSIPDMRLMLAKR